MHCSKKVHARLHVCAIMIGSKVAYVGLGYIAETVDDSLLVTTIAMLLHVQL